MKRKIAMLSAVMALSATGLALAFASRGVNANDAAKNAKEQAPKIATSKITNVTVYPDSALVTREVEVPAGDGVQELIVSPLPEMTIASSLYTESSEGMRVSTTRFRTRAVREDTREEVRKLEDEIRKLELESRKIQSEMKILNENLAYLGELENASAVSTTSATDKGKLDSNEIITLAKYLLEGRTDRAKQLVVLGEKVRDNAESLAFAQRELREASQGISRTERDAVIVVDRAGAAGKVKLNYLVSGAAWRPQYKFRAGKTAKDKIVVEYLAGIVQQTGEDWDRVNLVLSTAQPMLNSAPPDLHALVVSIVPQGTVAAGNTVAGLRGQLGALAGGKGGESKAPPRQTITALDRAEKKDVAEAIDAFRKAAQESANKKGEQDWNELSNYAANLEQVRDLVMAVSKTKPGDGTARSGRNDGPSVTYALGTRLSVPSRNDDQVIEIAKLQLEADYYYKAVPVLSPHVYRQAKLVNTSKNVLLQGEATMYNGSDFVGRMVLPLVAVGEEMIVGFGAEPQLQVTRQMMDRQRTMQAGNQVLKFEYRLLVSSYKQEKVNLQVWDRLPYAEKEAMNVNLVKATPEICKDPLYLREERPNNLLRWDLEITPDMKAEKALKINYEFSLELDKHASLGGFTTK